MLDVLFGLAFVATCVAATPAVLLGLFIWWLGKDAKTQKSNPSPYLGKGGTRDTAVPHGKSGTRNRVVLRIGNAKWYIPKTNIPETTSGKTRWVAVQVAIKCVMKGAPGPLDFYKETGATRTVRAGSFALMGSQGIARKGIWDHFQPLVLHGGSTETVILAFPVSDDEDSLVLIYDKSAHGNPLYLAVPTPTQSVWAV